MAQGAGGFEKEVGRDMEGRGQALETEGGASDPGRANLGSLGMRFGASPRREVSASVKWAVCVRASMFGLTGKITLKPWHML